MERTSGADGTNVASTSKGENKLCDTATKGSSQSYTHLNHCTTNRKCRYMRVCITAHATAHQMM